MITEEASTLVSAVAEFSYEEAFSRNLGWVTEWEQQALRFKRVAIAGMGGVGGFHLLTLARFGIGAFNIADCDNFELVNFNRQVGATLAAIGRPKVEVMAEMAWDINPELRIACFESGLTEANLDDFLAGVDLCVDGLDFFVLDIRRRLECALPPAWSSSDQRRSAGDGHRLSDFRPWRHELRGVVSPRWVIGGPAIH